MPLVLAIKNREAIVVATDTDDTYQDPSFGELMIMPNKSVLLLVGNLDAIRSAITSIIPKTTPSMSTAALAQLVQASLVLNVVPHLAEIKGRVEVIVAGFDPIRHIKEPGLYYMDSAQDFYLKFADGDAVAGGSTAAVTSLLAGHSFADSNVDHLKVLAKECISATKLRWPSSVRGRIRLGVLTTNGLLVQTL